jgi:hypothetical protein
LFDSSSSHFIHQVKSTNLFVVNLPKFTLRIISSFITFTLKRISKWEKSKKLLISDIYFNESTDFITYPTPLFTFLLNTRMLKDTKKMWQKTAPRHRTLVPFRLTGEIIKILPYFSGSVKHALCSRDILKFLKIISFITLKEGKKKEINDREWHVLCNVRWKNR